MVVDQVMLDAHAQAVMTVGEPFASPEPFDFRAQDLTRRIHALAPIMLRHRHGLASILGLRWC
jgi:hypothetical protein